MYIDIMLAFDMHVSRYSNYNSEQLLLTMEAVMMKSMHWVTSVERWNLVLRSNRLAEQQITRLDRSSDKNWSKKWSNNCSKTWYAYRAWEIGRSITHSLLTESTVSVTLKTFQLLSTYFDRYQLLEKQGA